MDNAKKLVELKHKFNDTSLNYDYHVPAKTTPIYGYNSTPNYAPLHKSIKRLKQETDIKSKKLKSLESTSANFLSLALLGIGALAIAKVGQKISKPLQNQVSKLPELKEATKEVVATQFAIPEVQKGKNILNAGAKTIVKQKQQPVPTKINLKDMSASSEIKDFIKNKEGLKLTAYKLGGENKYTIGYGHSKGDVTPNMTISKDKAEQFFESDVRVAESAVKRLVKVPLSQSQFDSLVSLVFNVGEGAFSKSKLLKKLNAGDYSGAATEFSDWVYGSNKQKLQGLVTRREYERNLFESGIKKPQISSTPQVKLSNRAPSQTSIEPYIPQKKAELPKATSTLNTSEGVIQIAQVGGKVKGYNLSTSEGNAKVTPWSKKYLEELGGSGNITSGARDWGAKGRRSHQSGNKLDFQINSDMTDEKIISICIPIMRHPATKEVAFECLIARDSKLKPNEIHKGSTKATNESVKRAKEIVTKIFKQYPDIQKKVQQRKLIIHTNWGWKYGSGPHLDVLISKDMLLKDSSYNLVNSNEIKGVDKARVALMPDEELETEDTLNPTTSPSMIVYEDVKNTNRVNLGKIGEIDLGQTYQNSYA